MAYLMMQIIRFAVAAQVAQKFFPFKIFTFNQMKIKIHANFILLFYSRHTTKNSLLHFSSTIKSLNKKERKDFIE